MLSGAAVKKRYGICAKKVAQPGGDYAVDHTRRSCCSTAGHFAATIATDEGDAPALDQLKALAG